MEERRDPEADAVTGPPVIASVAKLSPIQQAWSDYVDHGLSCKQCRSLDGGRCSDAERLHGDYVKAGNQAYERLADETP